MLQDSRYFLKFSRLSHVGGPYKSRMSCGVDGLVGWGGVDATNLEQIRIMGEE